MDTINFKGSFIRTKQFMEGGSLLFKSDNFNKVTLCTRLLVVSNYNQHRHQKK